MPDAVSLSDRVAALRNQALDLRARVDSDALRARLDQAINELERIPELFPERVAWQALLVPTGRIQTVLDIVGEAPRLDICR